MSKVFISGPDALSLLQSVLSNNVDDITQDNHGQLSLLLNPKGGLIAETYLKKEDDGISLYCSAKKTSIVLSELKKYTLRKKVQYGEPKTSNIIWSFSDDASPLPKFEGSLWQPEHGNYILLPENLLADIGPARQISSEEFNWHRIAHQMPIMGQDINEGDIPLMSSFLKQGISQHKGCYPGQETTVRLISRGEKLARKILCGQSSEYIAEGDVLKANGEKVGVLSSVAVGLENKPNLALAAVHRKGADHTKLDVFRNDEPCGHLTLRN